MKITLQNTSKIVELNGVEARVWEGQTESGIKVHAFITRIAAPESENLLAFAEELLQCSAPSPDVQVYPHRLIL